MASSNGLAESGHKPDIPTQADIAVFLKSLGNHDTVARAAGVPTSTYIKWHRKAGSKMSAVHLLQVVLRLDAVPQFTAWLAKCGTIHTRRAVTDLEGGAVVPAPKRSAAVPEKKKRPA